MRRCGEGRHGERRRDWRQGDTEWQTAVMREAGSAHIFAAMEPVVGDEQLFGPTRAGSALDRVQAYQLAQALAGPAFEDATLLQQSPLLSHVAPQLMRAEIGRASCRERAETVG